MSKKIQSTSIVPVEIIHNKIYLVRGQKVMLDRDLAQLYQVLTKNLNKAIQRNLGRFPEDFAFKLTKEEFDNLRFQFGTSKKGRGGSRYLPYVFTQEGVAMLSSILNSERAIQVNIQIMRTFAKLRELMFSQKDLARKIEYIERKYEERFQENDRKFMLVFKAIKELIGEKEEENKKRGPLGFQIPKQANNAKAKR